MCNYVAVNVDRLYLFVSQNNTVFFSERELKFMFAYVVCRLSVPFVHPTQAIEIFGNVSTPFGILAIHDLSVKILRRSSQGNPSDGGVKHKRGSRISDFGPIQRYISETVQYRSYVTINH